MKIVKEFSNFDVFAIVKELDTILINGSISNIYEVQDLLILKINSNFGKKNLIIKKDSRINLTEYDYPIPNFPNQYIRALRKLLKNRRILNVTQYKFDRIIILELTDREEGSWKFVIELFNKGNFLLLDQSNTIIVAKKYRKFKDRSILPKKEYIFPKSNEKDFFTLNKEDFKAFFENSENEIVREISRKLKLSGLYSEELCLRANVNKKEHGKNLNDDDFTKLYESFKRIRNEVLFGLIKAFIVFNEQEQEIAVLPFEMEIFKDHKRKEFSSFNEAVDDYYSKIDYESIKDPKDKKVDERIKNQQKILINQQEYLEELKLKKIKYYELGDFLYKNFHKFEKLISVILDARKKKYSWEEINRKLIKAKNEKLDGAEFFKKINPSTNQLLIKIKNNDVYLDLRKSIGENTNLIYSKGKKAEKKIKGTVSAIKKTEDKISNLKLEKESLEMGVDFLVKKPKRKWYEKFRWFNSSDGFLIIGGRDAATNEIIFKKYLDPYDLVFHTNFPGSPLVVIKNPENKEIPSTTIEETAVFVASFSRAWKENWGVVDTFYIQPDQITRSPPSGEYLQKGSFIISGKKNFIKSVKTELTIGLILVELKRGANNQNQGYYPKIICGPGTAIKKHAFKTITIISTKSKSFTKGKLAKELKSNFIRDIDKQLKKWVELLSIDEILLFLPNGFSMIKQ
ncbi:MAG: ribosome rescue protein RqcH [Promethearchaeota archaeon]|jgi:predicted ribosome quality control (RQC) complex YloA/Tae2 family protein